MRFGPTEYEDFDKTLSHICQTGSWVDYLAKFERLFNCMEGWTEKVLIGALTGGLKKEIATDISMYKPHTLVCVFEWAKMQADQFAQQKRANWGFGILGQGLLWFGLTSTDSNQGSDCV